MGKIKALPFGNIVLQVCSTNIGRFLYKKEKKNLFAHFALFSGGLAVTIIR